VKYQMEADLRSKFSKTPDCLFGQPLRFDGTHISWIESKANFGDAVEFRRNAKKQLVPYTELFGEGIVVYWFGHVKGLVPPEGVYVASKGFFDSARVEHGVLRGDPSLLVAGDAKGSPSARASPRPQRKPRPEREAEVPRSREHQGDQGGRRYVPSSHRSNRLSQVISR
jgi:hypothetical protein